MAEITVTELIEAVKAHPKYMELLEKGVPAEQALYVSFEGGMKADLESDDFVASDGRHVVVDKMGDGRVVGIEIT